MIFAIAAIALYLPASPFASSRLPGGGNFDPAQMVWFLRWTPYAIGHWLNLFYTNFIDYPSGVNLANNTSVPFLGLLGAPITILLGPVATFNFLLRFSLFASATSMYFVLRSGCHYRTAAFAGGLLYGFGPYLVGQGEQNAHLDIAFGAFIPILVWSAYELFIRRRHRPLLVGALMGAIAGLQALVAPEELVLAAVVLAIVLIVTTLARRSFDVATLRHIGVGIGTAALAFLLIAGDLLWWMFIGHGHLTGPVQPVALPAGIQAYSGDLLGPLIPTSNQLLAPSGLATIAGRFVGGNTSENGLYLGIPFVAVVLGTIFRLSKDRIVRLAAGAAAAAFVLSLGSRLTVDGTRTSIPLPEALLAHLPVLQNTIPARYGLDVSLFTCVVAAIGFDRALAHWRVRDSPSTITTRRRVQSYRVGILTGCLAIAVTMAPRAIASERFAWTSSLDAALHSIPTRDSVFTYPIPTPDSSQPMLWAATTGLSFRLVEAYATVRLPTGGGRQSPLLVSPPYVEEFLASAQFLVEDLYPPPQYATGPTGTAALCEFLDRYEADDVLFWPFGEDPARVANFLRRALGTPTVDAPGVQLWLKARSSCRR